MLKRAQKEQIVKELRAKLTAYQSVYMVEFSGVSIKQFDELRERIKSSGGYIRVVKNTLLSKAIEGLANGYKELAAYLTGPTCIILSNSPSEPARVLLEAKKNFGEDKLRLKVAWIEHMIFAGDDKLSELSKLKSRQELLSILLAMLRQPYERLASALRSPYVQLAGALKALAEKQSQQ